tara:strand:- start:4091 stop:4894 length:804 start_codon:yes stop_codon:yes gene_type:complete
MNNEELAKYYLIHKHEFYGEGGQQLLVQKLKKLINSTIENNILAIDVGSNVGDYVENIVDICKNKNLQILCFEPNPVNIEIFKQRITHKNVTLYETCLSNTNGKAKLYNWMNSKNNNPGNELAGLQGHGTEICDIEKYRLDFIIERDYNDYKKIKFIKIDTEGHDYNIIMGMGDLLYKTEYIIFECSNCLDDCRGPGLEYPMKTLVDYLDGYNFDVYRIGRKKLFKVNGEYWHDIYETNKFWSNCFAIKKEDKLIEKIININTFDYV